MEVVELNIATALDMRKTLNHPSFNKIGVPDSWLLPPGMVMAAANATVAIKVATTKQKDTVLFIHSSPSFLKSSCSFENNSLGVNPSSFFIWRNEDGTIFSTS
ncbi:unnamed protein product [Fraxinus pennsylvanica]|uniref:Uncharacterized protein n=1 Tax=Fraxinus pennsylvanica TaxID=56036 RepID=A0AAD1ZNZ5_9LAMI|nr:unnamed protein product [Fraxinus pennsylvanica]